jgi:hypothetical protein
MTSRFACCSKLPGRFSHWTLFLCFLVIPGIANATPLPTAAATRFSGSITLDGTLDEPASCDAQSFTLTRPSPALDKTYQQEMIL